MTERERLVEMLNEWGNKENDGVRAESIADYLLASGVIVPPCRVGDVVWINNKYGTIKSKVSNITLIEDNRFLVKLHYDVRYCYDNHIETLGYMGYTEKNFEFGKTVFFTKEEAEKVLHKINHNSLCETETYKIKQ